MPRIVCLYHGDDCVDGFGAAYAVWSRFERCGNAETITYIPVTYGSPLPMDLTGCVVVLLDFCYPRELLEDLCRRVVSLVILDHHKTALRETSGLEEWARIHLRTSVKVVIEPHKSGAMIAWQYFNPDVPVPELIHYIQDRDLYRHDLPQSKEVHAALQSHPFDFWLWHNGLTVARLKSEGEHILRYYDKVKEKLVGNATRKPVAGYDVPVVNCPRQFASDVAAELAVGELFAAAFYIKGDNMMFSLRSTPGVGIDVEQIARRYNGGGHKHAAAFKVAVK